MKQLSLHAHLILPMNIENPRAKNVAPFNEVHMMSCVINSNRVLRISFYSEVAKQYRFSRHCVRLHFDYKEDDRRRLKMVLFINASENKDHPLLRRFHSKGDTY